MHRLLLICLLILLGAGSAPAQVADSNLGVRPKSWTLGLDIAPMISWYDEMPLPGVALHGAGMAAASGFGYMAGLSLTQWYGSTWAIRTDIRYARQHLGASLERTVTTQVMSDPRDTRIPEPAPVPVVIESTADFNLLHMSVGYMQEFAEIGPLRLSILVGPTSAYVTSTNRHETMELAPSVVGRFFNPTGLPSENDRRKLVLYDGDPNDHSDIRVGMLASLQFESEISHDLSIISSVEYDFPLFKFDKKMTEDRVRSLLVHATLAWNFY